VRRFITSNLIRSRIGFHCGVRKKAPIFSQFICSTEMVQHSSEWVFVRDNLDDAQSVLSISFSDEESIPDFSSYNLPLSEFIFISPGNALHQQRSMGWIVPLRKVLHVSSPRVFWVNSHFFTDFGPESTSEITLTIPIQFSGNICKSFSIIPALGKVASDKLRAGKVVGSMFRPDLSSIPLTRRLGVDDGFLSTVCNFG